MLWESSKIPSGFCVVPTSFPLFWAGFRRFPFPSETHQVNVLLGRRRIASVENLPFESCPLRQDLEARLRDQRADRLGRELPMTQSDYPIAAFRFPIPNATTGVLDLMWTSRSTERLSAMPIVGP